MIKNIFGDKNQFGMNMKCSNGIKDEFPVR